NDGAFLSKFKSQKEQASPIAVSACAGAETSAKRRHETYLQRFTLLFEKIFPDCRAAGITSEKFGHYLDNLLQSPDHRNNIRDAIVALHRYGRDIKRGPESKSAIEAVKRIKVKDAASNQAPRISLTFLHGVPGTLIHSESFLNRADATKKGAVLQIRQ